MKKKVSLLFVLIVMSLAGFAQLKMDTQGDVGIGIADPEEKLHVDGDIYLEESGNVWIGANTDGGGPRLRMHHSGTSGNAYIDYYPNLILRVGTSSVPSYFKFTSSGYLGIRRMSPNYALDVNGIIRANNVAVDSDIRLKDNVKKLGAQSEKIKKLEAISYTMKEEFPYGDSVVASLKKHGEMDTLAHTDELTSKLKGRTQIGFSAQDLQAVFPELVFADNNGYLSVNYIGLIPVLVEALKEQDAKIEALEDEVNDAKKIKNSFASESIDVTVYENILYQNAPNPFSESTKIEYSLEEGATDAKICVYDMNGTQLKCYELEQTGTGSITIYGSELVAGMYYYSLIADGQLIDTKRMVLTD